MFDDQNKFLARICIRILFCNHSFRLLNTFRIQIRTCDLRVRMQIREA
jgi:hypothetical protein